MNAVPAADAPGADELCLTRVPLVPEVRLFLADDAVIYWARLEAAVGQALPAPFWASAWAGGQALARYVLDHPGVVAGRSVLDLASGSGMVGIAAAMAGASAVVANDIDPYAVAAIAANAEANGVSVAVSQDDLLDGDANGVDVVLAGDALYQQAIADRMLRFLVRAANSGAHVLVGDPGRGHIADVLEVVARYRIPVIDVPEDANLQECTVFTVRRR